MSHISHGTRQVQSASTIRSSGAMIITSNKAPGDDIKHPSASTGSRLENSYRIDAGPTFPERKAEEVVRQVVEETMESVTGYDPKASNALATDIANKIKTRVKAMCIPRFKIVSFAVVGQKETAALEMTSRCVLNPKLDKFAEYSTTVRGVYAVGLVYALYQE